VKDTPFGVHLIGSVSDGVMAGLYARAEVLCYVPLEEGFGLPVVEAMRAATVVVSSDVPAAAGATILVDPFDTASIASGILVAASDATRRSGTIAAGLLRSETLTWQKTAAAHVALWRELMEL
jgi:glycosyltransferase involved in cell wall biosynthesis